MGENVFTALSTSKLISVSSGLELHDGAGTGAVDGAGAGTGGIGS